MTVQIAVILAFALGVACGMAWIRASRADKNERLVRTIASLRAELSDQRLRKALDIWAEAEDDS